MRGIVTLLMAAGLFLTTCGYSQGTAASACAIFNACVDEYMGISECVYQMELYRSASGYGMGGGDSTFQSLVQNASCVAGAGADCDRVLACLNRGNVVSNCSEGSRCVDGRTLSLCEYVSSGEGYDTVEVTVRCSDLGLECVEALGTDSHGCAHSESQSVSGVEVTCVGKVARVHVYNVSIPYDCGFFGANCLPGSYQEWEFEPCEGTGAVCDRYEFEERCDGNYLIDCMGGKESRMDCGKLGMTCFQGSYQANCSFTGCNSEDFEEQCSDGTITYCGPRGEATLSCTDLGFSSCEGDFGRVRCVK